MVQNNIIANIERAGGIRLDRTDVPGTENVVIFYTDKGKPFYKCTKHDRYFHPDFARDKAGLLIPLCAECFWENEENEVDWMLGPPGVDVIEEEPLLVDEQIVCEIDSCMDLAVEECINLECRKCVCEKHMTTRNLCVPCAELMGAMYCGE